MCDALPGARCSSHMRKQVIAKEQGIKSSYAKIKDLDGEIQRAHESHDMRKLDDLLNKQDTTFQRLRVLHDELVDAKNDFYTTPDGIKELQEAVNKEKNPKTKAQLQAMMNEGVQTRQRQKHSLKLVKRNKTNLENVNLASRLNSLEKYKREYLKAHAEGGDINAPLGRYVIARDRILLAEAGNREASAVRSVSLSDALRKQGDNSDWSGYYARIPDDYLVESKSEYFPYGNPIERVNSVSRDGEGYAVTLANGETIRSGELLLPIYARTPAPSHQ